jgi:hypothetical protein
MLLAPMIRIGCTKALESFGIMPDKNCTHKLRNCGLPGIIFPHATRGAPLTCGNLIGVHTSVIRATVSR